ncbi:MAG: energy transducer TonB [Chitinophagales bacterium]
MKHLLQILLLLCLLQTACTKDEAQPQFESIECLVEINGAFELTAVTKYAEYIGGQEAFFRAIGQEIRYPPEARKNGIEGTVIIEFDVTQTGEVENITLKEDIGEGCGEEAKRMFEVITEGVSFHPAELNRVPVKVRKELPIKFKLE